MSTKEDFPLHKGSNSQKELSRAGEINIRRQGTNRASTDEPSKNTVKLHSQRQEQSDFCSEY